MTEPAAPDQAGGGEVDRIHDLEVAGDTEVSPDQLRLELGQFFQGPLPPANELQAYANIPGAMDMIREIAMAPYELSRQALAQDHELQKADSQAQQGIVARGQHYALTIAIIAAFDLVGLASVPLINNRMKQQPGVLPVPPPAVGPGEGQSSLEKPKP